MLYYNYDTERFNFQKELLELYGIQDLSLLHLISKEQYGVGGLGADTHTFYHDHFYQKLRSGWQEIKDFYLGLIKEMVAPLINEDKMLIQKFPSYRVHLPKNKAVDKWHYDSDELHKHPEGEINFWMPMTPAYDTNTMWVEEHQGQKDYLPVIGDYGDLIQFNGNKHEHGNKLNETGRTRVSFDFRVLPYSLYNPDFTKQSATSGLKFVEGGYYDLYQVE